MKVDPIESHLFLSGILMRYGYDFRGYSEASLHRRMSAVLTKTGKESLLDVLKDILRSPEVFRSVLPLLTIGTTEFFRDPAFFKALKEEVFPVLASYPRLRIWIAGCSTGEEVISLSILLKEASLLGRSTIYATDINPVVLAKAKSGIYPLESLKTFAKNYAQAGGKHIPTEYYSSDYGLVKFNPELIRNVVFSEHNLATDSNFTEAHLILCRNVIIYFNKDLQGRVLGLFASSLIKKGFLGLGSKESLRFSPVATDFSSINESMRVFQNVSPIQTSRTQAKMQEGGQV